MWRIGNIVLFGILLGLLGSAGALAQDKEAYYRTGYLYFSQGNYDEALKAYQKALELDPQYVEARYWLGKTLEQMGRVSEAVQEWRTVLTLAPRHQDAFKKWRSYAPSFVRDGEVVERYREIFLNEEGPFQFSREEGWSSLAPLGFVLLGQGDFTSLYVASRIFRWARERLSPLFAPYEEQAIKRALERVGGGDLRLVYRFLREVTDRFGKDPAWQETLQKAFEAVFALSIGEEAQGAEGVEFTLAGGVVEKRVLYGGGSGGEASFFLQER